MKINDYERLDADLREPYVFRQIMDNLLNKNVYALSLYNEQLK